MKKLSLYILILILAYGIFASTVRAQDAETKTSDSGNYILLSPLPCEAGSSEGCVQNKDGSYTLQNFDPTNAQGENSKLGDYLNIMIRIFIGVCAVLAVMMIVVGGLEWMTSGLVSTKEEGIHRMTGAVLGLLLALGAWTILNQINPDLLKTDLASLTTQTVAVTLDQQIKSYSGQGKCEPVSNPASACSPENLSRAGFPNGTHASSVCNGESAGNPNLASGVDKCSDGTSFSYGLFQINVIAHANEIPGGVCRDIFEVKGGGSQGSCLESKNGICIKRNCSVKNPTKLQSCINYINNPVNNIAYAKNLQAARDWGQWGAYNSCRGTFPPK